MPTPTYDLIEEKVLTSNMGGIEFTSIPGTYKDLIIECTVSLTAAGQCWGYVNNDFSSGLYSTTTLIGSGTAAVSTRQSNDNTISAQNTLYNIGTGWTTVTFHAMSYANTSINKTFLTRTSAAGNSVTATVSLWRNTAAITRFGVSTFNTPNFVTGSTFRLWGVAG